MEIGLLQDRCQLSGLKNEPPDAKEKKMSKALRTMVVVGALSLGIGNLFGDGAKQSTAVKEDTKAPAAAQSNAPVAGKATSKKKATTHHAKQGHQHSHTKSTAQPAASAAAVPK
jgi:ABC-type nickel/cobalt efflux system permease component RcnA